MGVTDMIVRDSYGVEESNSISEFGYELMDAVNDSGITVELDDPDLKRILRLRLLGERGYPFYDVSYCFGELRDGTKVRVHIPWNPIPLKQYGGLDRALVEMCKSVNVYGKGLGILDPSVVSICR